MVVHVKMYRYYVVVHVIHVYILCGNSCHTILCGEPSSLYRNCSIFRDTPKQLFPLTVCIQRLLDSDIPLPWLQEIDRTCTTASGIRFGIWVNTTLKSFRIKTVDFTTAKMSTDIPRSLSGASVAVRSVFLPYHFVRRGTELAGVGRGQGTPSTTGLLSADEAIHEVRPIEPSHQRCSSRNWTHTPSSLPNHICSREMRRNANRGAHA